MANKVVDSPIGTLEWAYIDGEGKKDLQGNPKYSIDVVVTPEKAEEFKALIDKFWDENKPKGAKAPKSNSMYPHTVKDEEASKEAGENVYKETGNFVIRFKTGTTYQDGANKVVKVFNAKGNEVSLQGKKIGNGSRGRVNGVMAVYDVSAVNRGVTLYLNGVQITKLVEFTGGPNFSAVDEEEGDFEGVGDVGGISDDAEEPSTPRL